MARIYPNNLAEMGWSIVEGITSTSEFVDLANSLGEVLQGPNGDRVKTLKVMNSSEAPKGTFSETYGIGSFPYHTDTAFYEVPVRLVALRAISGDFRRPTHVLGFPDFLKGALGKSDRNVADSTWILSTGTSTRYCRMGFRINGELGYRFDPNCMKAAGRTTQMIEAPLRAAAHRLQPQCVDWTPGRVVIIDNWKCLHARGVPPADERERVLERIYIK